MSDLWQLGLLDRVHCRRATTPRCSVTQTYTQLALTNLHDFKINQNYGRLGLELTLILWTGIVC